jgi:hypothetical protein
MILGSRLQRIVAAVSVTALTVAVIGLMLLSSTPLGCEPAKALHIKLSPNRCANVASKISNPSPFPTYFQTPSPIPNPVPVTANPYPQPASNPYPQPASNPYPEPASANPYPDSGSGGFPPFGGPASGPGTPGLNLNCRLPIYAGGPGSGGFIVFPNGNFIADPRSAVAVPSPSPGGASPTPPAIGPGPGPGGYPGFYGMSYDQVDSRWLPVPSRWVSPSPAGRVYAYPGQPDGVYVQNITKGTEVELGQGKTWSVLDVTQVGVFAVTGSTGGLWLLRWDGSVVQRISSGYWQGVSQLQAVAYGTATSSVPQGAGNTIIQFDFGTGATTDYFSAPPPQQSSVGGFDGAGNPVIFVSGQGGSQIYIGLGPNRSNQIADLTGSNFYPNSPAISDQHGVWLAGYSGIALHVPGAWYKMSNFGGQLAGGCY